MKNNKNLTAAFYGGIIVALTMASIIVFQNQNFIQRDLKTDVFDYDSPIVAAIPPENSVIPNNFKSISIKLKGILNQATLGTDTVSLKDTNDQTISGYPSYDEQTKTIFFRPDFHLPPGNITLSISADLKTISGHSIGPAKFSYTVKNTTDTVPLALIAINPPNNSSGISPLIPAMDFIFNKALDCSDYNMDIWSAWSSKTISPREEAVGAALPDIYTKCDSEAQSLHIDFGAPLWNETTYEVTLQPNILKDTGGNIFNGYTTRFTTSPHENIIPLQAKADFNTKGFEILFNQPIPINIVTDLQRYTLTCNSNSIALNNANSNYFVQEKKLIVTGLNLTEKNNCEITVSPNFVTMNGTTFTEENRILKDFGRGVHKLPTGVDYFENEIKRKISGFRWDSCVKCRSTEENIAAKFFNPNYVFPTTNFTGMYTDYNFTIALTQPVSNGDMLRLTFSPGYNVSRARLPNLPINRNIFNNPIKPVAFGTPIKDAVNRTVDLPFSMAQNISIGNNGATIKFALTDIGNPLTASTNNIIQWKTIDSQGFTKEGDHLFNPVTTREKGNGQIIIRVLNENTGGNVDGAWLVFKGPAIGTKKIRTDETGTAILGNITVPKDTTKSNHIRVYLDESQIPFQFSAQSGKSLDFGINVNNSTATGKFFLTPVPELKIKGTITHPENLGGTKVHVWTGNTTSIKKTVQLNASGTTNFTIYVPTEGDYQIGISNYVDFNGEGRENTNIIMPKPINLLVTPTTSPVNVNFNLAKTTQFITGIVKNQDNRPIPNAHIAISSEHENSNIWLTNNTITNIDGTYAVATVPGNFVIEAYVKGFPHSAKKAVTMKASDTTLTTDFTLREPVIAVSGSVKDANDFGIKDANVSCSNNTGDTVDVQTDDNGKYTLYVYNNEWVCRALTVSKGYIDVIKKRSITTAISNLDFMENNTIQFGAITGKLLINENEPYAGNLVAAIKYDAGSKKIINQEYSTYTDAEGNFQLKVEKNSTTQPYKVLYLTEGNGMLEAAKDIIIGPNHTNLGIIIGPRQNMVTFSATNLPPNSNELDLRLYMANTQNTEWDKIRVFNRKAARKIRLFEGKYTLEAIVPGLGKKTQEFTLSGKDTTINIDFSDLSTTTLTVQVNDNATKTPIGDALVEAFDNNNNGLFANAITNGNGQATLEVAPGTYTVRTSKKDFSASNITTSANKTEYTFELTAATSSISGAVKDANNNPVVNAIVNAKTVDKSTSTHEITDHSGNFNLKVAPNTTWNIETITAEGKFTSQNNINAGTTNIVLTPNQNLPGFTGAISVNNNIDATQENDITTAFANVDIGSNTLGNDANGTNVVLKKHMALPKTEIATPVGFGLEVNATDTMGNRITKSSGHLGIRIIFDKDTINGMASVKGFNKKTLKGQIGYYDDIKKTWILLPTTQKVKVQMASGGDYTTISIDDYITSFEQFANTNDTFIQNIANTNHFSTFALINKEETDSVTSVVSPTQEQTQQSATTMPATAPGQTGGGGGGGGGQGGSSGGGGGDSGGGLNTTHGTARTRASKIPASNIINQPTEDVQITPTLLLNKTKVMKGSPIRIFGKSSPVNWITIAISGRERLSINVNTSIDGSYSYNFNTGILKPGRYSVQAKNANLQSKSVTFNVGSENVLSEINGNLTGDIDNDSFVNLNDFSIMAYWYGKERPKNLLELREFKKSDVNNDNSVDLEDFRTLIVNWTG